MGGGSIGLESVENLSRRGVAVTIIEKEDQLMPPLDYEMAAILHRHLRDQDITLHLGNGVESFHEKDNRSYLHIVFWQFEFQSPFRLEFHGEDKLITYYGAQIDGEAIRQ